MSLTLYAHPFSSYSQKVLIALWENEVSFTYRHMEHEGAANELMRLWPERKFPVLVDGTDTVVETSIIIEYLEQTRPGPVRFLPDEPKAALEVRLLDRFFDLYVMTPVQRAVAEALRSSPDRLPEARENAAEALETAYGWLEARLRGRRWAGGENWSLADCAAAPSLFYADWVHRIGPTHPWLFDYRKKLLERPSVARAVEEGRPYRHYFPLGAPDRD